MKTDKIYVWSVFVRVFHWVLAATIVLNLYIVEEGESAHEWIGYTAAAFVIMRFLWSIFVSGYENWRDLLPSPKRLIQHLQQEISKKHTHHYGHNPLATTVMFVMLMAVLGLAITGYMMSMDQFWGEDWVEDLHEWLSHTVVVGVVLHLIGIAIESKRSKELIALSMVHGYRKKK